MVPSNRPWRIAAYIRRNNEGQPVVWEPAANTWSGAYKNEHNALHVALKLNMSVLKYRNRDFSFEYFVYAAGHKPKRFVQIPINEE